MGKLFAYLPENLPPLDGVRASDRPYAMWFVSTLLRKTKLGRRPVEHFHRMPSDIIRETYPKDAFARVRTWLKSAGVLEEDGVFSPGRKSLGFRLAEEYASAKLKVVPVSSMELARKLAGGPPPANYAGIITEASHLTVSGEVADLAGHDIGLASLAARDLWWTVCRFGRLHYPLTNMRKDNRSLLRLRSSRLWQVDTRNSQPLYLAALLRKWKEEGRRRTRAQRRHTPTLPPPPCVGGYLDGCQNDDLSRFAELAVSGQLYSVIASATGVCESKVKKLVFGVLYGRRPPESCPVGTYMLETVPTVVGTVLSLNRARRSWLARRMQMAESSLVISGENSATAEFSRRTGRSPLTIHDSLVCVDGQQDAAVAALSDAFVAAYGIAPPLRVERFGG